MYDTETSICSCEGDTDRKASTQQGKTINIDNTMAGQALGGYPSLLITDELAGILGEGR